MIEKDKVYCGDSSELLSMVDSESVDLVVTSPPYDDLRNYNNSLNGWGKDKFESIAREIYRVMKDGGVVVWVVDDKTKNGSESCTCFEQVLYFRSIGFNLNDTMIWLKKNPMPQVSQPRYRQCFEYMFVFSKGKPKTFNPIMRDCKEGGLRYKSTVKLIDGEGERKSIDYIVNSETVENNVWSIAVARNKKVYDVDGNELKHPAVFPYDIPYRHIKSWSNEGDLVLDPFVGSGTTLLAAIDLNRHFIGIDSNSDYCKIAEMRINERKIIVNQS